MTAWDLAQTLGGEFILRIEDLDTTRCRPHFEDGIFDDLRWLGLTWPEPVLRQSRRGPAYTAALDRLRALGVLYACTCTRRDIAQTLTAPQEGATPQIYPGTCRHRNIEPTPTAALRLDIAAALALTGSLIFEEISEGKQPVTDALGDVVLARRDIGTAYHLAVVVDDAAQGISHVVRGEDLKPATSIHRLLQALLDLPVPVWHHHRLIRDPSGQRLAKRDAARALAQLRAEGASPAEIRRRVGL